MLFFPIKLVLQPSISPPSPEPIYLKNNPNRSLMDAHLCTKFEVNSLIPSKVIEPTNRRTDRQIFFARLVFHHVLGHFNPI